METEFVFRVLGWVFRSGRRSQVTMDKKIEIDDLLKIFSLGLGCRVS